MILCLALSAMACIRNIFSIYMFSDVGKNMVCLLITQQVKLHCKESNSLFDMAQFARSQLVSTLEDPDQMSVTRGGRPPMATLGLTPEAN